LGASAASGALTGLALASFGQLFPERPLLIIVGLLLLAVACWNALHPPIRGLPPHLQVPRRWARHVPVGRRFTLWGALLGAGVLTAIPYSSFLVLLAGSVSVGAGSGAAYGLARAAGGLMIGRTGNDPQKAMELLPKFERTGRLVNLTVTILASAGVLSFWLVGSA